MTRRIRNTAASATSDRKPDHSRRSDVHQAVQNATTVTPGSAPVDCPVSGFCLPVGLPPTQPKLEATRLEGQRLRDLELVVRAWLDLEAVQDRGQRQQDLVLSELATDAGPCSGTERLVDVGP